MTDRGNGGEAAKPTLAVRNLWKVFGPAESKLTPSSKLLDLPNAEFRTQTGSTIAVRDVSFDVPEGEVFVVMGLSGSGKSTLVRCLTRLIEPSLGQVFLDGDDVLAKSPQQMRELRRHRFAMVFQNFGLLPTAASSTTSPSASRSEATSGQSATSARGRWRPWSGSTPRRLVSRPALGRAAAACRVGAGPCGRPEVMFLVEPFSALDR